MGQLAMRIENQGIPAEGRDGWMVMLLKDLREVARKDRMNASVDALSFAIAALQRETSEMNAGASARAPAEQGCEVTRH
jgi:hypothetical protein